MSHQKPSFLDPLQAACLVVGNYFHNAAQSDTLPPSLVKPCQKAAAELKSPADPQTALKRHIDHFAAIAADKKSAPSVKAAAQAILRDADDLTSEPGTLQLNAAGIACGFAPGRRAW